MSKTKFSKNYYKMLKANKKNILAKAKEASKDPWDWQPPLDLLIAQLTFIRDYYRNGENVHSAENYEWDETAPKLSRLQMVQKMLNAYNEWQTCEDKYTRIILRSEPNATAQINELLNAGWYVEEKDFELEKNNKLSNSYVCLRKYENFNQNTQEFNKEYKQHRREFFNLLNDYIEEL